MRPDPYQTRARELANAAGLDPDARASSGLACTLQTSEKEIFNMAYRAWICETCRSLNPRRDTIWICPGCGEDRRRTARSGEFESAQDIVPAVQSAMAVVAGASEPDQRLLDEVQILGGLPTWREVPAARFLSWSEAMQYAYCAARDENAMLDDDVSDWWMDFYAERAVAYRREIHAT